ncbi:MAG TPA: alpha-amylase family glycosyl hydrolase, partial [Waddliaceae bacterium]
ILKSKPVKCSDAENYMYHYYNKNLTSESLEKFYRKIPEKERATVPSPYGEGVDYTKYKKYGSFYGESGTNFVVFAPNASKASVVLTSEDEKDRVEHPMEKQPSGDWKLTLPVKPGQKYQYKVNETIKQNPYGLSHSPSHLSSKHLDKTPFSVVVNSDHKWDDDKWMNNRAEKAGRPAPMSIYEMLPTCWKKKDGDFLNYRELAKDLVDYCKKMNYTHVQLMGILEHPDERSWGYQVSGYFAPNSRLGSVDDFKFMINYLHNNNIGIILDWVPGHFAKDEFGLKEFDGTKLYEPGGLRYFFTIRNLFLKFGGEHFDFKKREVREFLISSAHYWLKEMHLDGLRVDCVTSLLTTEDSDSGNLFIRDFNAVVHRHNLGAFTSVEEHLGYSEITASSHINGFDFDLKLHAGWMHHIFEYFCTPIRSRKQQYHEVYRAIMSDNFHKQIMYFCHDDVCLKYNTLINKTPEINSSNKRYANLRAILSLMLCLPGKKLLFMGTEFGNEDPWDSYIGKNKGMLDDMSIPGSQVAEMVSKLNEIYKGEPSFYEKDANGKDLEWIEDADQRVHAYRRKSSQSSSFGCFHNFIGEKVQEFKVRVKKTDNELIVPKEIFNSDDIAFGGKGRLNHVIKIEENDEEIIYTIQVPPLSTVIIKEI